jgi:predicted Fe-S protein YdhL (DUF1289 family)
MIESPCTKVCQLDPAGRVCIGCRRTVEEIVAWTRYTDEERRRIMRELRKRPLPDGAA